MQSNFFTGVLLPLAQAIVMLGMGLSLLPKDFKQITRYPKAAALGAICQILLLPLIAVAITQVIPMQPAIAVGLIILAICPGGPTSNLITYLAKGDVALSVALTAVSSIVTVFTIPVFANLALQHFLGQSSEISLPLGQTMLQICLIMLLPTAIGMVIRYHFPNPARRMEKHISRFAIGMLTLIVGLLLLREGAKLPQFLAQVGLAILLLNLCATLAGFWIGKLFRLTFAQQLCIAIEVGIQNVTLAITITAGLLNSADMAVPAAVYSLLMYLTGAGVIFCGRRFSSVKPVLSKSSLDTVSLK